jgi:hypothetical protein
MATDITAQKIVGNVGAAGCNQDFLNRAADVVPGIEQRSVHVEQVDGKRWDHQAG